MLHEMNQMPVMRSQNAASPVVSGSSSPQNSRNIDPDFSVMPDNGIIDPDFSVIPDNGMIDPDFSVMPDNGMIDPDFSVMPDNGMIDPDFSVIPDNSGSFYPCPGCLPLPVQTVGARFLNASPEYSNLTVEVDNRIIFTSMNLAEISRYRRYSRGFHRVTVMAANGLVYLTQNVFLGNNSTIAIVSSNNRMRLTTITDGGCAATYSRSCLRVCNLAYASGAVNVILSNGYTILYNNRPGIPGSFSKLQPGSYPVSVASSARPAITLLSSYINLNPNRVYTLYILNWNPSPDTIQIRLAEDMR